MAREDRQYECVLLGATGYTGKYAAEHITTHLPTDFKWAVAGRSEAKLQSLVTDLKALNSDRSQPGIEVVQLDKASLVDLVRKTKILITTVGPYHRYGTTVVEACAETGTHYLDVTGEIPWVYDMVHNYHETAKRTGAIMIPQNGFESAPADLMCWMLVSHIRQAIGVGTGEIVHCLHDINGGVSGGTLATLLGIFDHYSISEFARANERWSLCPVSPPKKPAGTPLFETITGWGLYDSGKFYGSSFRFNTYTKTRNVLTAFAFHVVLVIAFGSLFLPPVRWLLKRLVYQPGDGPTREQDKSHHVSWHAIANADTSASDPNEPRRAYATMQWTGSMYHLTGVLSAEAAFVLARESEETLAGELGGGMVTPATLGAVYLERLQRAGLETSVRMMP